MTLEMADRVTRAVLYEGYLLYPYTPQATKNRQRWTFGGLYPPHWADKGLGADRADLCLQCLVEGGDDATVDVRVRFLHLVERTTRRRGGGGEPRTVDEWEEAVEREHAVLGLALRELAATPFESLVALPGATWTEPLRDARGAVAGEVERRQRPLTARLRIAAVRLDDGLHRLEVTLCNTSPAAPERRAEAMLHSLVSTSLVTAVARGAFVSAIDPPEALRAHASGCKSVGTWPVLLGEPGDRSMLLAAPIILYDHPQVAPESAGDLFDGGEIDEVLSLRILTLTDEEKAAIRETDARGRAMLERTERLTEADLLNMHGAWRGSDGRPLVAEARPHTVEVAGRTLGRGSRVRLRPQRVADVFDLVLAGKTATIESVEQSLEGEIHLTVAVDDDPGRDLEAKAQLGHRFYFRPEDVEPL